MAIRIEKAVSDCLGFGHDGDGRAVFVEDALPGELVECTEKERRNGFSIMECAEVLEPSPLRRAPYCLLSQSSSSSDSAAFSKPARSKRLSTGSSL